MPAAYMTASGKYEFGPQLRLQVSYDVKRDDDAGADAEPTLRHSPAYPERRFADGRTGLPFTPLNSQFGINSGTAMRLSDRTRRAPRLTGTYGRTHYTLRLTDESRTTTAQLRRDEHRPVRQTSPARFRRR